MSKTVVIGDIHGRDIWKQIVAKEHDTDKIIFIGDYLDSHDDITPVAQIHNLKDIMVFHSANRARCILLIGNHDYHYMSGVSEHYSGFQAVMHWEFNQLLEAAMAYNQLQVCHAEGKFLFSHAGITKTWYENADIDTGDLVSDVNSLMSFHIKKLGFTPGPKHNPYGDEICQSPIWVRPSSLKADAIEGYTQVVGHTMQPKLTKFSDNIYLIDCLNYTKEYLVIHDSITPEIVQL